MQGGQHEIVGEGEEEGEEDPGEGERQGRAQKPLNLAKNLVILKGGPKRSAKKPQTNPRPRARTPCRSTKL